MISTTMVTVLFIFSWDNCSFKRCLQGDEGVLNVVFMCVHSRVWLLVNFPTYDFVVTLDDEQVYVVKRNTSGE